MANDMNWCGFTGNLGADPELRFAPSGVAICNISIAVSGRKKAGDQWEDKTTWIPLVFIGRRAEVLGNYASKGAKIRVSGELQVRSWEKDGQKRYQTEILVNDLQLLSSQNGSQSPRQQAAPAQLPQNTNYDGGEIDDIPF